MDCMHSLMGCIAERTRFVDWVPVVTSWIERLTGVPVLFAAPADTWFSSLSTWLAMWVMSRITFVKLVRMLFGLSARTLKSPV